MNGKILLHIPLNPNTKVITGICITQEKDPRFSKPDMIQRVSFWMSDFASCNHFFPEETAITDILKFALRQLGNYTNDGFWSDRECPRLKTESRYLVPLVEKEIIERGELIAECGEIK